VIYDKNANDGKGLTDKQKADFEDGQLQSAKDQYGNANIHLDLTYAAGSMQTEDGKTTVTGLQAGSLNVVVTDQVQTAASGMAGKLRSHSSIQIPTIYRTRWHISLWVTHRDGELG
jgi:hypothetical protein